MLPPDGRVSLPEELTFSETDGVMNVCAFLDTEGSLQTQLIVTLTVEDGGTASKDMTSLPKLFDQCYNIFIPTALNDDYILSVPFVYLIGPFDDGGNNEMCPTISIQDDEFLEGNQMLSVAVSSTNLNPNSIEIAMSGVIITILDDEGME